MTDGYQNAVLIFKRLIAEHKNMPKLCMKRLFTRRDSNVFFMLSRILRYGSVADLKNSIAWLKKEDVYPIQHFTGEEYPGITYKILTFVLNHPSIAYNVIRGRKLLKK